MRRLPPLTGIEAFVHAARLGSVKAAAEALALSPPALTRRIQALESHLGHPLFDRRPQSIHLNMQGRILLGDIAPLVDQLALAMDRAAGAGDVMRLRLAVLPLFATQRLMPRLPTLRAAHPGLHIDIDTGAHGLSRLDEGIDAAITIAAEIEPHLYARSLGSDRLVAIGAASPPDGASRPREPADLAHSTILLHRDLPAIWDIWRDAVGLSSLEPAAIDHFDSGQLMLDAAARGLGVALLLESNLQAAKDPRLVPLFGIKVESPYRYWFACRRASLGRPAVRIFHDWLFETLGDGSGDERPLGWSAEPAVLPPTAPA